MNAIWLTAAPSAGACYYAPFMSALAEGKTWTEYGPFRLGILSKPFAAITIVGVVILAYAGIQPPFDPISFPCSRTSSSRSTSSPIR